MSYILNSPERFQQESAAGMLLALGASLRAVDGGVLRAGARRQGQVAVVIGGGSGHYPAFAGLVGHGLAHGAAMGNVFASPAARQIYNVARAAESGAGVLLSFGNYTGDLISFTRAQEMLRAEGIQAEILPVTDELASAPADRASERRGVAGDLIVFKVAGASAERGDSLEQVLAHARRANECTRTLGVAFSGATLPGADEPLFTVPPGHMTIGVGIHGEPGLMTVPIESARDIARRLWSAIVAEKPEGSADDLVILINGLGSIKAEELFLLYGEVHGLASESRFRVADVQVGEFATSFEMAGVSVTVSWLPQEERDLWLAACDAPAFRRGQVDRTAGDGDVSDEPAVTEERRFSGSGTGRAVLPFLHRAADALASSEKMLGELDAVAGDGDHGIGMRRGVVGALEAAQGAVDRGANIAETLAAAADGWEDSAGGTSGAIWGAMLRAVGERLPPEDEPSPADVAAALAAARDAVRLFGAEPGDRTLLDALEGLVDGYIDADADMSTAWRSAASAAESAAQATAQMTPRRGRARTHSSKELKTPDAGAVSLALVAAALVGDAEKGE